MDYLADLLLGLGALGAAFYCFILSRRLRKFNNLRNGMGGAVAVLSAQVDDMTRTLEQARQSAEESARQLAELTARAEGSARNLELMMASLHDMPEDTARQRAEARNETRHMPATKEGSPPPLFLSNRTMGVSQ